MSGGHFDYLQFRLSEIVESIKDEIYNNNRPPHKEPSNRWEEEDNEIWEKNGCRTWSKETIEEFQKAIYYLRRAEAYATRVDWLLSGDDGEKSFHRRLKNDIQEIELIEKNEKERENKGLFPYEDYIDRLNTD